MHIAFNINRLALTGLAATLTSLVRHCSSSETLHFYFLHHGLSNTDQININTLLARCDFRGKINFIYFDPEQHFGFLPGLHGDLTIYGRLLIPELIAADQVLYLDSDLLVLTDITVLATYNLKDVLVAAVKGSTVQHQLDQDFLLHRCGMPKDAPYFNSGVVLFNCNYWRQHGFSRKWQQCAREWGIELVSHDQTLLNALANGCFYPLPAAFNLPWFPGRRSEQRNGGVIHFVGSPKPWDFMGNILTGGYKLWRAYTPDFWLAEYGGLSWQKFLRTWRIRSSIGRTLKTSIH